VDELFEQWAEKKPRARALLRAGNRARKVLESGVGTPPRDSPSCSSPSAGLFEELGR
jgi:hypothetical protein